MEIKARFDHFNINVTDLERSLAFYDRALGLKEISRKQADDAASSSPTWATEKPGSAWS